VEALTSVRAQPWWNSEWPIMTSTDRLPVSIGKAAPSDGVGVSDLIGLREATGLNGELVTFVFRGEHVTALAQLDPTPEFRISMTPSKTRRTPIGSLAVFQNQRDRPVKLPYVRQ
jgi:hypothetical protein